MDAEKQQAELERLREENQKLREACEACADVVGVVSDGSSTQWALKKLREVGIDR